MVAENGGPAAFGIADCFMQNTGESISVEYIIAQNHGRGFISDKFFANEESLGKTVRRMLHGIGQMDPKVTAITEKFLKSGSIYRSGNDQNILYTG